MLKATKRNRVLRIPDEKSREYKALGYTISTMDGEIVYAPENKDKTIATLRAENAALKEQLAERTVKKEAKPKAEPETGTAKTADKKLAASR